MPENEEIYLELDFGVIATVALEYDFEVDTWEDEYAIFNDGSIYVRIYWPDLKFMVYDENGELVWIDDDMVEMIETMFALKRR